MAILKPQGEKMDIVCSWDDQQSWHNCIIDSSSMLEKKTSQIQVPGQMEII